MLSNLNFTVGRDNYGGVDRFWFVPEKEIDYVDNTGQVVLKADKVWYLGTATKYTIDFINPSVEGRGGTTYEPLLTGTTSKHTPTMEALLKKMRGQRFVLIYKDKNGYLNQVGSKGQPLTFQTEQTSGKTPDNKNGVNFSFSGFTKNPPINYLREIVVSTGPGIPLPTYQPSTVYVNNELVRSMQPGERFDITTQFSLQFDVI